jgi:hypothetical protein
MSSRRSWIAFALLIAAALTSASCSKQATLKPAAGKLVSITNCVPNPDQITLSIDNGDQAVWSSADGQTYNITFKNASPFANAVPQVMPNAPASSGALSTWTKAECFLFGGTSICKFPYTITSSNNSCRVDPVVVVQK